MNRLNCVICLEKINTDPLYVLKNFPFLYVPKPTGYSSDEDIFFNLELYGCNNCGCVQLKYLLDPKVLYEIPHNLTYNTPIWKEHHKLFSEFICKNNNCSIIEVGGYSGVLANIIKNINNKITYKILDLCDIDPKIENVKFIQGNCENYTFNKDETVVLSHVFEHLYKPHSFIKNLKINNVQNIYISIPNMLDQIKFKRIPIIHQEHTFFCSFDNIKYLFGYYGYKCIESYFYLNQSIFFHFGLSSSLFSLKEINIFENSEHIKNGLIDAYIYNQDTISNLNVSNNFYISPAGLYGQIIYYFLKDHCKRKCLGFLDNDPSKTGKRLYGIPKQHGNIYKMDEIKNKENLLILLYNGPYSNEIKKQLLDINSSVNITPVLT